MIRLFLCRHLCAARLTALAAWLLSSASAATAQPASSPDEIRALSITSIRVIPERPAPGTLCQLYVTVRNSGPRPASRVRFDVRLNARRPAPYATTTYFNIVAPQRSAEIRLYNFRSEGPAGGSMDIEVRLAGGDWMRSEVAADGVRTWSSTGRVLEMGAAARAAVRLQDGAESVPTRAADPTSAPRAGAADARMMFRDVTAESGIRFVHERPMFDSRLAHIMTWVTSIHAGTCAADYDRDGDVDFYLLTSKEGAPNALYRNEGDGTFVDVAASSGVADLNDADGLSMTCLFADVDNDGNQDLLVASYGRTRLLRGDAAGRFAEVGQKAGLVETGNASSAVFFDYDADGWLDLLVGRYFPHDLRRLTTSAALPTSFETARNGAPNLLYRNNRDGTFTEVAASLGMDDRGWALALTAGDLDNDGDLDVYVANDFGPDVVYRNNGDGTFTDVTDDAIGPDSDAGMNADIGDYNGDGLLDLYVTNITNHVFDQGNMLWKNLGDLRFVNMSREMNVRDGGWGWAAKFMDFDNDGDLDLFTVNGFVSAGPVDIFRRPGQIARGDVSDIRSWPDMRGLSLSGHERDLLFRNDGLEFVEIGKAAGVDSVDDGRGIAPGDIDGDGDLDFLVTNVAASPILYRNEVGNKLSWIAAELVGAVGNRDGIGARVTVTVGQQRHIREIDGGSGYNAQGSRVAHVGLGKAAVVDAIEVRWPGGARVRYTGVPSRTRAVIPEERQP